MVQTWYHDSQTFIWLPFTLNLVMVSIRKKSISEWLLYSYSNRRIFEISAWWLDSRWNWGPKSKEEGEMGKRAMGKEVG